MLLLLLFLLLLLLMLLLSLPQEPEEDSTAAGVQGRAELGATQLLVARGIVASSAFL